VKTEDVYLRKYLTHVCTLIIYRRPLNLEGNKKKFKRPQTPIPPIRKQDSSWARSDSEKAEVFAKHLEEVFTPLPPRNSDKDIELLLETPCQMSLPIKPFCLKQVRRHTENLNPRKVPGYDLITRVILKQLQRKD
jgi:hypothetical protein